MPALNATPELLSIKIKVIEAMANGKLVITTPIGAEGINAVYGKHLLICKTTEEFKEAIKKCCADKNYAIEIAKGGQDLIKIDFNPAKITEQLLSLIKGTAKA